MNLERSAVEVIAEDIYRGNVSRSSTGRDDSGNATTLAAPLNIERSDVEVLAIKDSIYSGRVSRSSTGRDASGNFLFWAPPFQTSQWGELHHEPDVDWGDLFFDLLSVAAVFKLGHLLSEDIIYEQHWRPLFRFMAIIWSLALTWYQKMQLRARFEYTDMCHLLVQTAEFLLVALSIAYLPSENKHTEHIDVMEEHRYHATGFSLCMMGYFLVQSGRWIEIYRARACTELSPGAGSYAQTELVSTLGTACLYLVAAVANLTVEVHEERYFLRITYVAMLWTAGVVWAMLLQWYAYVVIPRKLTAEFGPVIAKKKLQNFRVPMSIPYVIHRFGEWIMYLLGEGVLSILILDISMTQFWDLEVAFMGLLIIVMINFQIFTTYPADPEKHAMERSDKTGLKYAFVIMFILPNILIWSVVGINVLIKLTHDADVDLEESQHRLHRALSSEYSAYASEYSSATYAYAFTEYSSATNSSYADDDEATSEKLRQFTIVLLFNALALSHMSIATLAFFHQHGIRAYFKGVYKVLTRQDCPEATVKQVKFSAAKWATVSALIFCAHRLDMRTEVAINVAALIVLIQSIIVAVENPEEVGGKKARETSLTAQSSHHEFELPTFGASGAGAAADSSSNDDAEHSRRQSEHFKHIAAGLSMTAASRVMLASPETWRTRGRSADSGFVNQWKLSTGNLKQTSSGEVQLGNQNEKLDL